jgi:outer membrane protein assembly factor BamB
MRLHWNTPIALDGYLYGSSGENSDDAELRCIDLATGKVKWSEPGLGRSSLMYVDGHLVCLTENGHVHLLRATPEKYDSVASFVPKNNDKNAEPAAGESAPNLLTYPAWAAPILAHGLLYLRGHDQLACFELIPAANR